MRGKIREDLIQAVLSGKDLNTLVEKVAIYLNNPIVIINASYNIIAHSESFKVNDPTWNNAVKRGYITLEFAATLNNWQSLKDEDKTHECMTVNQINLLRRRFYKLIIDNRLMGYMNITEVNKEFDDIDEECYYFASQIIAREIFLQQKMILPHRTTRNEDIVLELTSERYVNRLHFLERVEFSQLKVHQSYWIACADLSNFLSYNANEDTFKHELLSFFPFATIVIIDKILIILNEEKHCFYHDFKKSQQLDYFLKDKKLCFGISDVFHDLYDFKRYEKQAIAAYELKEYLLSTPLNYVFYDQVKLYDLLKQHPKEQLIQFCHQKIWKIYEYDNEHETDYLNTLRIYLQTNHSIKITATYMYLHRNTISYRISKVKELFEIDLDDDLIVNQLLLSCQIVQIWSAA